MMTLLSCLVLTSNSSQASFALPLLKNFHRNLSQTAVTSMWVGPFHGSCFMHAASYRGRIVLSTLAMHCSSEVRGTGSAMGFKNFLGMFSCINNLMATFITVCSVCWSMTLAKELKCATTVERWAWASDTWSKIPVMSSFSPFLLTFLGSLWMNSSPQEASSLDPPPQGPHMLCVVADVGIQGQ